MKQKAVTLFESECGQAKIYVENVMPIGNFHDFVLEVKGIMVDRMVAAQKEDEALAKEQQKIQEISEPQNTCCA